MVRQTIISNFVPVFLKNPRAILYHLEINLCVCHTDMQAAEEGHDIFSKTHHSTLVENMKANLIFSCNYTGKVDKHLVLYTHTLKAELV